MGRSHWEAVWPSQHILRWPQSPNLPSLPSVTLPSSFGPVRLGIQYWPHSFVVSFATFWSGLRLVNGQGVAKIAWSARVRDGPHPKCEPSGLYPNRVEGFHLLTVDLGPLILVPMRDAQSPRHAALPEYTHTHPRRLRSLWFFCSQSGRNSRSYDRSFGQAW